jgi:hypothetical protein
VSWSGDYYFKWLQTCVLRFRSILRILDWSAILNTRKLLQILIERATAGTIKRCVCGSPALLGFLYKELTNYSLSVCYRGCKWSWTLYLSFPRILFSRILQLFDGGRREIVFIFGREMETREDRSRDERERNKDVSLFTHSEQRLFRSRKKRSVCVCVCTYLFYSRWKCWEYISRWKSRNCPTPGNTSSESRKVGSSQNHISLYYNDNLQATQLD